MQNKARKKSCLSHMARSQSGARQLSNSTSLSLSQEGEARKKERERTALTGEWIQAEEDPNTGRLGLTLACSLPLLHWSFYSYHQSPPLLL